MEGSATTTLLREMFWIYYPGFLFWPAKISLTIIITVLFFKRKITKKKESLLSIDWRKKKCEHLEKLWLRVDHPLSYHPGPPHWCLHEHHPYVCLDDHHLCVHLLLFQKGRYVNLFIYLSSNNCINLLYNLKSFSFS